MKTTRTTGRRRALMLYLAGLEVQDIFLTEHRRFE